MLEQPKHQQEKVPENVAILDLPEARYRIIYERHGDVHTAAEVGKVDALAMEVSSDLDFSNRKDAEWLLRGLWGRELENRDPETGKRASVERAWAVKEHLEQNSIPLYLVDISGSKYLEPLMVGSAALNGLEAAAGVSAAGYLATTLKRPKELSRRDLLRGAIAAAIAAKGGIQAASLAADVEAFTVKGHFQHSDIAKKALRLNQAVSPESHGVPLTLRNAVWAQKLKDIAQEMKERKGRKPEIAMRVGAGHSGLEDMLRASPEERLQIIRRYMTVLRPLLDRGGKFMISPIVKYEHDKTNWKWVLSRISKNKELEKLEQ